MENIRTRSVSNYHIPMNLGAKASSGYAMAALLVAMSVMAILLSVALPNWSHMIRREKEEELIFRGNQYARAFSMYQRKYANAAPPNLDVLLIRSGFCERSSRIRSRRTKTVSFSCCTPGSSRVEAAVRGARER